MPNILEIDGKAWLWIRFLPAAALLRARSLVSGRIHSIYRIVLTIEIRMLAEICVPGDEPPDLGIVRSRSDVQEA